MKDFLMVMGVFILIPVLMINIAAIIIGIDSEAIGESCKWPSNRISYIVPGYPLGCWLGKTP